MGARALFGRRVIYTDVAEINAGNIIDVLQKALFVHLQNSADIDYLYRYYRGDQPVLYREKEVRPEICNKVVENRANEIVSFRPEGRQRSTEAQQSLLGLLDSGTVVCHVADF